MRKIDIPLVGRNVRTLGQIAKITEIALIDYFSVIGNGHSIDLHCVAFVDKVKQGWKRVAKAHAAPTAMTDVIDALKFLVEVCLIPKLGIVLIQRVPGWGFQTTFSA
jgi:hypothetical protein